jgi:Ala-tRNA(Pro) deacylase
MTIAIAVRRYLEDCGVEYEVLEHPRTLTSAKTAETGHISGERLAKAVVLKAEQGYVMAVLPASCHVQLGQIRGCLHRQIGLATETEVAELFDDCDLGAVPAIGSAYGLDVIVDDRLIDEPDIYFEGGDHRSLIHVSSAQFRRLMADAAHGAFSRHD